MHIKPLIPASRCSPAVSRWAQRSAETAHYGCGENVSVSMIRDLALVVDREKAKMGLFITLAEPTDPMLKEALKEGYFETVVGGELP